MAPPKSIHELKKQAQAANPSLASIVPPASSTPGAPASFSSSFGTLVDSYQTNTPAKVKLIDSFLLFFLISGVAQFAYCVLVTSFPYNAFLGAFASSAGQFVLLAGLRAQVAPPLPNAAAPVSATTSTTSTTSSTAGSTKIVKTEAEFKEVSKERAFTDFCFASVVLHFFVFNFLG